MIYYTYTTISLNNNKLFGVSWEVANIFVVVQGQVTNSVYEEEWIS